MTIPLPTISASHAGGFAPPQHGLPKLPKMSMSYSGFFTHRAAAAFCALALRSSGVIFTELYCKAQRDSN
jgi:hypothetical protein